MPKTNRLKDTKLSFNMKLYFVYTISFIFMIIGVYFYFFYLDKSFVWYIDGIKQHYSALAYYGQWLRELARNIFINHDFTIPTWSFSLGYGNDILTTLHYYCIGDPLCLLSAIVKTRYTEYLYMALIILRLYLAGFGFLLMCNKLNLKSKYNIVFAFTYVFCGFSLIAAIRHPYFITGMVYMPYIICGVEDIFNKKNPWIFITSVCFITASNFYFAYMAIILTIIYVLVRFFTSKHEKIAKEFFSEIFKFGAFGLIGVTLSFVVLLPVILAIFTNDRYAAENAVHLLYPIKYYERVFAGFLGQTSAGYWTYLGYSAISLISVFYIFQKRKKYTDLKIMFAIVMILQLFPVFGHIMNGFSYVTNRFCWITSLLLSFISAYVFDDLMHASSKEKTRVLICSLTYFIINLFLRYGKNESSLLQYSILFIILLLLVGDSVSFKSKTKRILISIFTIVSILVNSTYLFSPNYNNYVAEFLDRGQSIEDSTNSLSYKFKSTINNNESFARFETADTTNANIALLSHGHGVASYWSLVAGQAPTFIREMQLIAPNPYDNRNSDHRAFLNSLSSVKYFICQNGTNVPYGFNTNPIGKDNYNGKKYELYENNNFLPIGYTYDSFISREHYDSLTALEKQEAIMQSAVVETESLDCSNEYKITSKEIPYKLIYDDNVVKSNDGFYVKEKDVKIKLEFEGLENSETYLDINNLYVEEMDFTQLNNVLNLDGNKKTNASKATIFKRKYDHHYYVPKSSFPIVIKNTLNNNENKQKFNYNTPEFQFYSGIDDFTINLGYQKEPQKYVEITLPEKGFYSWDDIKIICQPMDNYDEYVNSLKENSIKEVSMKGNSVSGEIKLDNPKLLCMSIPYSQGWSAKVDGKEVDIIPTNTWCIGINLEAGEHKIDLEYETPGLKIGAIVSVVSTLIFGGIEIYYFVKKKKIDSNVEQ